MYAPIFSECANVSIHNGTLTLHMGKKKKKQNTETKFSGESI